MNLRIMKKYYYFSFEVRDEDLIGSGIVNSEKSCFPISEVMDELSIKYDAEVVVTFWHEISSEEYDAINERNEISDLLDIDNGYLN